MNNMMSDENLAEMFTSAESEQAVNEPSTMERIQADFEKAFESVKDQLGDSWEDVRTIYDMARDKSFTMDFLTDSVEGFWSFCQSYVDWVSIFEVKAFLYFLENPQSPLRHP